MKLRNINFKPEASAEVIAKAKKWLVDKKPEFRSTANFCIFDAKGNDYPRIGGACHNQIMYCTLRDRAVVATEVGYNRWAQLGTSEVYKAYVKTKKLIEPYIRWLTTESYMAEFILNRDDLDFCCEYGLVVSADVMTPLMQNIMIASRNVHELSNKAFEIFNDLTQNRGVSGDLAYIAVFGSGISDAPETSAVRSVSGHRPTALLNLPALKNFVVGELGDGYGGPAFDFNNPKIFYRNTLSYTGGLRLFFPHGQGVQDGVSISGRTFEHMIYQLTKQDDFKEALSAHRKSLNDPNGIYRPPNPFTKKTIADAPQTHEISYKEFVEFALPWIQKEIVEPLVSGVEA